MRLAILAILLVAGSVAADEPSNLEFKGTLVEPPPCTLGSEGVIKVDFGPRVGIKKVDSGIYRQSVDIHLECDENTQPWQLLLSWRGTPAGFDPLKATVATEQSALGVRLELNGQPFPLEQKVEIARDTPPKLEVVLVHDTQSGESVLDTGEFSARATLRAEYQ